MNVDKALFRLQISVGYLLNQENLNILPRPASQQNVLMSPLPFPIPPPRLQQSNQSFSCLHQTVPKMRSKMKSQLIDMRHQIILT